MNNKKMGMMIGIATFIVIISLLVKAYISVVTIDGDIGIERNYGEAYITSVVNIGDNSKVDSTTYNADDIVPTELELVDKLIEKGYTIEKYDTALDNKINARRIYAKKEKEYIDITYCKDIDEAKKVFTLYEETYEEFYLMAQNVTYTYCISSGDSFDAAGFSSLSNSGIQYINHENK